MLACSSSLTLVYVGFIMPIPQLRVLLAYLQHFADKDSDGKVSVTSTLKSASHWRHALVVQHDAYAHLHLQHLGFCTPC